MAKLLLDQQEMETQIIIQELIEDGSDPDAIYIIEHHLSSFSFEELEKAVVKAFKLGYEVSDVEELDTDENLTLYCCDLITESPLDAEIINTQITQLTELIRQYDINYDGWGTYFENDGSSEHSDMLDDTDLQEETSYH